MGILVTRALRGMNSDLRLTVRREDDSVAGQAAATAALETCAEWLGAMERRFSRFLPASELNALNAGAGSEVIVGEDLFAVVALALDAAARTDGLFDPTVLGALRAAGYDRGFDVIGQREIGAAPAAASAAGAARCGRWRDIHLDAARRAILLPRGVALDLGGIAKSWAADVLAERFLAPFPAALVDLGGDLRVRGGPEPGVPWLIGIEDPRGAAASSRPPRYLAGVRLSSGGVATSGDARRWWLRAGRRMHHLIDPRMGAPASVAPRPDGGGRRALAWTALAPTTAEADVLAKVAFLHGYPAGLGLLARGTAAAGVCILEDGSVAATPNLEEYLHAMAPAPTRA